MPKCSSFVHRKVLNSIDSEIVCTSMPAYTDMNFILIIESDRNAAIVKNHGFLGKIETRVLNICQVDKEEQIEDSLVMTKCHDGLWTDSFEVKHIGGGYAGLNYAELYHQTSRGKNLLTGMTCEYKELLEN